MRKVIAGINVSLDGFCDHTLGIADDEIHQHYKELLQSGGVILFGRITFQLMEFWPTVVKNPTGNKAMDEFAATIDKIPKVVFSRTLKNLEWKTATLATRELKEEVLALKKQTGKDILVGSRSLIIALLNLNLIDEFQLCFQPIAAGKGLPLFEKISNRIDFRLVNTKTFGCGAIVLYYEPAKK